MKSRVHPKYKTRYRVTNWREYESGLVQRGDVTVWLSPDALKAWRAKPTGRRGAQPKFSDPAIETALTMRLVFHLPLRQSEGFLGSIFKLMGVDLAVPDHTTLSRRSASLDVSLTRSQGKGPIDLIIDSSGLAVVGEGEWAAAKHGGNGRRGRPHSVGHRRRGLRHQADLRCCRSPRGRGSRATIQDREHISTSPKVQGAQPDSEASERGRTETVEEGVRIPSPGSG